MNILDENVPDSQHLLLRRLGVAVGQMVLGVGRKSMKDREIITMLHRLDRRTFFTLDSDFYDRRLPHRSYCLVHLHVEEDAVAEYVRRLLRHRNANTRAKRLGCVIRVMPSGFAVWQVNQEVARHFSWE